MSPEELDAAFAAFKASLGGTRPVGPTVRELIAQYTISTDHKRRGSGSKTVAGRLRRMELAWGDRFATAITYDDMDAFASERMESDDVTRFTAELDLIQLAAVLAWAMKRRKIQYNPMAGYEYSGKAGGRDRVYTDDEIDTWLDAAKKCDAMLARAMVTVMRRTGIRPIELLRLKKASINWANGLTRVLHTTTKNGKERPCVIWPCGLDALREVARDDCPYVLPSPRFPGVAVSMATINTDWRTAAEVSGLAMDSDGSAPELYSMRGTLATYLGMTIGLNEQQLMAAMGWETPTMARKYVRTGEKQILEQAQWLQGIAAASDVSKDDQALLQARWLQSKLKNTRHLISVPDTATKSKYAK